VSGSGSIGELSDRWTEDEPSTSGSWRARLGRRLALLIAGLSVLVFAPIAIGTQGGAQRIVLLSTTALVLVGLVRLARPDVSERLRSRGVVLAFVAIGTVGYATLGFLSAPGAAMAAAIVSAGLLLDRRTMFVTIGFCLTCMIVVGTLMVHDVLPRPAVADISPGAAGPWVRSSVLTIILLAIVGAAVALVVEILESSVAEVAESGRRRREAELQVLHAQSTQLIGQLAASLAHDVNNHLTVVSWWTSVLAEQQDDAERASASAAIAQSIDDASVLIQRLLMLGRRDVPVARPLALDVLLEEREPVFRGLVPSDVDVVVSADAGAWCRIDPAQVAQVVMNLAVNARDAMPHGGTLTIEARRIRTDGLVEETGAIPRGEWVVLAVEDTGTGMDDDTRRRAAEPFFTTKPAGLGTGLGLATTAAIADQADGRLRIESEPGRGTRVELWLPAVDAAPTAAPVDRPGHDRLDGFRILLVDDTPHVLDVAARTLTAAGATVTTASDANEALHASRAGTFDVLCTDVVMPGTPVSELLDRFEAEHPEAVVLLCSGYVGEELVRNGIERQRYPLLPKPYTPAQLVDSIGTLLSSRAVRTEG
jgi:signal transduction histidine kinase